MSTTSPQMLLHWQQLASNLSWWLFPQKSLSEGWPKSAWRAGMSVGDCPGHLSQDGKTCPLRVTPLSRKGILNCVRVEKVELCTSLCAFTHSSPLTAVDVMQLAASSFCCLDFPSMWTITGNRESNSSFALSWFCQAVSWQQQERKLR